ncbi:hypothetical protein VO57_015415 [Citromicrobium bathyomarinum]|nr:hypothetical protein [Citromicrobium sp. JL2201]KPM20419.1 hypothetical protein VO57_15985 [Citromicrobium sp. JL2201]
MAEQSLKWNGDALSAKMRRAQIAGVNGTMALCVQDAKNDHAWLNRTGVLEGSIDIAEGATVVANGVEGTWGSKGVKYARIHELGGTIEHPGGTPYKIVDGGMAVFVSKDDPEAANLPKTKPHEIVVPARPYLRPAADTRYPELAKNVKAAFEAMEGPDLPPATGGKK